MPVVGPKLKKLLYLVFGLFALLAVNSVYLVSVSLSEWASGLSYENYFFQFMFLGHLVLGLVIVLPVVVYGIIHIRNARNRPNRRAVRAGFALFFTSLLLLVTGLLLTRFIVDLKQPAVRSTMYWLHVISPLVVAWLFILHRLAGRRIKWKVGATWAAVAGVFALIMIVLHSQDPRQWNVAGPTQGEQYFFPSLVRTSTGNFVPARTLMNDQYCLNCHADIHNHWLHSAHRFSSFSNPAYLFSVRETRRVAMERDGNVQASRWCAGCHDPVPFLSGEFEHPRFDDPDYDLSTDPMAGAGVTCTVCHAITHINSTKGNADYTIEEPAHYPFAFSENTILQWVNQQLVKAKPAFHKKTFLKPLHKTAEFCSTCHKVHLPPEVNNYKWLRGQNHFDAYHLSGVSGHGVQSWYYPPKAIHNCSECHMPLMKSADFGARDFNQSGSLSVHNHQFPAANTGVPHLLGMPSWVNQAHDKFMDGFIRVDIFALKDGPAIDSPLIAPLRPTVPTLEPGKKYLLDVVIRTLKMGHLFTQGTADSNEIWLDVTMSSGERIIGRSGGLGPDGEVDPWSHFVNIYMLDRHGNRIDRRNPQDIFTPLYNHQIPPGAADTIHFAFTVPPDVTDAIAVDVKLQYRKFDTAYMKHFEGNEFDGNDLPISTLASDQLSFPVSTSSTRPETLDSTIPEWERFNDYGIGLFRKGEEGSSKGELRQAEAAFREVERLGQPDGPLNRARVYIKEGRLVDAVKALQLAASFNPPAPAWSVAYFTGLVNKQNGNLDEAIANFRAVIDMDTEETRRREFDFSQDYNLLNELGQTLVERARLERGDERREAREAFLREAESRFQQTLSLDAENLAAHYNLSLIYAQLGEGEKAEAHRRLHAKYKPDDNARDYAVSVARRNHAAADHAAEAIVIYDLQRPDAFEIPSTISTTQEVARHD